MNSTEQTTELDCALLAAQSKFPVIEKTKDNPWYKSKYAPYEAIYKGVKPALCENGLLLVHDPKVEFNDIDAAVTYKGMEDSNGTTEIIACAKVTVNTIIRHAKTGQERSVEFTAYPDRSNMHGVQAAVTYLKRNNIILLLDIAVGDEDDDGNGGIQDPENQRGRQQRPASTNRRPSSNGVKPAFTTGSGKPVNMQQATSGLKPEDLEPQPGDLPFGDGLPGVGQMNDDHPPYHDNERVELNSNEQPSQKVDPARPITDAERKRLGIVDRKMVDTMTTLLKGKGIPPEKMFPYLENVWGYSTISQMRVSDYKPVMDVIEKHPEEIMNFTPEVE